MAPRKSPKSGSPAPGARREAKHGSKNGKKEGVSGSSFFTWFMVIALLGVWTSVAVVWFELVDYEEVLGKLGIYDADGDGDFDVEDAKILLGLKERSVLEQPTPKEEVIQQPSEQPYVRAEYEAEAEPEDEIQSLLREALNSQLGETEEEHGHRQAARQFQQQEENNEILEDVVEVPVEEEDYNSELEDKIPDVLASPESFQEGTHEYEADVEGKYEADVEGTYEPIEPDASELNLEDALVDETETVSEGEEQPENMVNEHDGDPVTEHYYEALEDETLQGKVDVPDSVTEHTDSDEREHEKANVGDQPRETEVPVQAEGHSKDDLVDT